MKLLLFLFFVLTVRTGTAQSNMVAICPNDTLIEKLLGARDILGHNIVVKLTATLHFNVGKPWEVNVTKTIGDTILQLPKSYENSVLEWVSYRAYFDKVGDSNLVKLKSGKIIPLLPSYNRNSVSQYMDTSLVKKLNYTYHWQKSGGQRNVETIKQTVHYYDTPNTPPIICKINSVPAGINANVYAISKRSWNQLKYPQQPLSSEEVRKLAPRLFEKRIGNTSRQINFPASDQPYYLIFNSGDKWSIHFMDPATSASKTFDYDIH